MPCLSSIERQTFTGDFFSDVTEHKVMNFCTFVIYNYIYIRSIYIIYVQKNKGRVRIRMQLAWLARVWLEDHIYLIYMNECVCMCLTACAITTCRMLAIGGSNNVIHTLIAILEITASILTWLTSNFWQSPSSYEETHISFYIPCIHCARVCMCVSNSVSFIIWCRR